MPKMKTHKGAKKRIKITGTGKCLVKSSGTSHIMTKKSNKRKRNLKKDVALKDATSTQIGILLPYGKGR